MNISWLAVVPDNLITDDPGLMSDHGEHLER